jgi:hypothetical protein
VVSRFAVAAVGLALHLPVDEKANAYAGSNGDRSEAMAKAAGALPPLSESGRVGVILDLDRDAETAAKRADNIRRAPTGQGVRIVDDARSPVDRAGDCDADARRRRRNAS